MDFDGFLPFSAIARSKRILKRIWKQERIRFQLQRRTTLSAEISDSKTFTVETGDYTATLDQAWDPSDGTSWFEFELLHKGEPIFRNLNWRHSEHFYVDPKVVLRHAKAFESAYNTQA